MTPASSAAMPCMGENCKPSCADVAAAWNRFKAYCEESHWKVYKCMSFLARVNGCADPSLIHPSPEGDDMTCPDKARVDRWSQAEIRLARAMQEAAVDHDAHPGRQARVRRAGLPGD